MVEHCTPKIGNIFKKKRKKATHKLVFSLTNVFLKLASMN